MERNMLKKIYGLSLLFVMHFVSASAFMLPIATRFHNQTPHILDLYCQSTHPSPDCYGEGCVMSSWPLLNIKPGETRDVDLWIFREDSSHLVLSVLSVLNSDSKQADSYLVDHFVNSNYDYLAELTLVMDAAKSNIVGTYSGNIQYSISKNHHDYSLDIVIF